MKYTVWAGAFAVLATPLAAEIINIEPGADAEEMLQEALILAEPGDEIVIAEGFYPIRNQLSLAVEDVTVRGAGMDKTILSFDGQTGGSEGLLITADGAVVQDLAVEDTLGDGIKSKGVDGVAFVRVRVEWTNGPDELNGAYGLYPVQSSNVLIEDSVAIGASDAGIYVGQSDGIIVRGSRAEYNVAGLEIENSFNADVYSNHLENNTGGILVFDLPDLPIQGGNHVRVFDNVSINNNVKNFAPEGNIVGIVPAGTGMLVMGNTDVEVFGNTFDQNQTANFLFGAYVRDYDDENFQPYPKRVHIHHNIFGRGGYAPDDSEFGNVLRDVVGAPVPDIVFDGVMPVWRYLTIGVPSDWEHSIHSNSHSSERIYANADFVGYFGLTWFHSVGRDVSEHSAELEPLPAATVTIRGQDVTSEMF